MPTLTPLQALRIGFVIAALLFLASAHRTRAKALYIPAGLVAGGLHLFWSRLGRPGAHPLLTSPGSAVRSGGFRGQQAGPSQAPPSSWPRQIAGTFARFGNVRRSSPGRVRSCDNASSGACEVRAATSRPRSGGSGLCAPPRGHDQGRARGRWPRGAPVPLARLEG
jgi:hypothetical protein